ncbi:SMI1/KNR4 family protein [Pseudoalteromonas sp. SSM20]|uniref:SMI1/KNR4 family protein n=1 Tax=Pseudoalteromonas sp. SSM20 TaxID=3139394 RepID=UPI003BAB6421
MQLLFTKLHQLEKETYNWDEISCELYSDGTYKFERKFFNFNRYLTSFPKGCIKPIYYNVGWLPLIKDHGGNFIGIDLDPDEKGTAGQVIVYGRDDTDMFVVANSWTEFLDFNIALIKAKPNELLYDGHLHDLYREMIVPSN